MSDRFNTQQKSMSDLWLSLPKNHNHNIPFIFPYGLICMEKIKCPMYAPIVPNIQCRFCGLYPDIHRKYYIYSNYARKIQRKYIGRLFHKFIKKNIKVIKEKSLYFHYFMNIKIYYFKYYRNWNYDTLQNFLANNR